MQVQATEYLPVSDLPLNQTSGLVGVPGWVPLPQSASVILSGSFSQSQDGVSSSKHQYFKRWLRWLERTKGVLFTHLKAHICHSCGPPWGICSVRPLTQGWLRQHSQVGCLTSTLEKQNETKQKFLWMIPYWWHPFTDTFPEQDIPKPCDWHQVPLQWSF